MNEHPQRAAYVLTSKEFVGAEKDFCCLVMHAKCLQCCHNVRKNKFIFISQDSGEIKVSSTKSNIAEVVSHCLVKIFEDSQWK